VTIKPYTGTGLWAVAVLPLPRFNEEFYRIVPLSLGLLNIWRRWP